MLNLVLMLKTVLILIPKMLDSNTKNAKFEKGDHVRISKYQNIFTKEYAPSWSEKVL